MKTKPKPVYTCLLCERKFPSRYSAKVHVCKPKPLD